MNLTITQNVDKDDLDGVNDFLDEENDTNNNNNNQNKKSRAEPGPQVQVENPKAFGCTWSPEFPSTKGLQQQQPAPNQFSCAEPGPQASIQVENPNAFGCTWSPESASTRGAEILRRAEQAAVGIWGALK
ncbi:hypothetical protein BGZ65_006882 [Modicella reniformis]|uniref:Uncharacterized protein n=1 Tax=Modicella reniformis TaxID=1440133 RepID=A0A9P6IJ73_9FUNG|nr:hypothetical protein BGZ65_006882 [Modicella reniformis]